MNPGREELRIGAGAGFWGDSPDGPAQLVRQGDIHYLVLDYLAEITLSIMARAMERHPQAGYATDFVTHVIAPLAKELVSKGVKVVANAGGCNPLACQQALERELARQGIALKVAAVTGDDVLGEVRAAAGTWREMWSGEPLPERMATANAYLGAFPIARALAAGADIVITGRCADSALVLGPLVHEFGWSPTDWNLLAAGSLAGHVIECGVQATGGYATDWKATAKDWADMGFPIAVCRRDGSFTVTKPAQTGGRVDVDVISEQVTYETGDPQNYVLPDVVCDLSQVRVEQVGPDQVRVSGARGKPCTPTYKVSVTAPEGYRCLATMMVRGIDAAAKARAMGEAILARCRRMFDQNGWADFAETSVEILGAEESYGPHAATRAWREVVLKVAARHTEAAALELFSREIFPSATAMAPGISGIFGGRPKVQPVMRLYSVLLPRSSAQVRVHVGEHVLDDVAGPPASAWAALPARQAPPVTADAPATRAAPDGTRTVRLIDLAYARSGDKGDASNIAVIARKPEYLPVIAAQLTAERVADHLRHLAEGPVTRFDWPGLNAFNFLIERALGGGGVASLRYDPQGKSHAQMLLEAPLHVPATWSIEIP
ncbi:acyclic terpene utilization AtuA family protein [Hydrogenophaga sp. BPS33]|uniref:acyclic terpene utilization AtuA family protein n=1 Tax=Hydrogenophaga sp. BPS33 TaxID=2651974 RepID=UPI00131FC4FA|nr:acyclic terpene utilization AtuA family protein [Hydrogenophaga sp. BPS33]QHE87033.1 DUF1446 domain-containing protein [Hydrogenophaga sp. BPS33]